MAPDEPAAQAGANGFGAAPDPAAADGQNDASKTSAALAASATPPQTDWANAAEQVRNTSSTALKAFAGLATVLPGTSPLLASVADLHADLRGAVALSGAVIGLLGLGVIIWQAAQVNLTQITTIRDLVIPDDGARELVSELEEFPVTKDHYLGGRTVKQLLKIRARASLQEATAQAGLDGVHGQIASANDKATLEGLVAQGQPMSRMWMPSLATSPTG